MNNLVKRTIFGFLFVSIMIGALLWCKYSFAALVIVMIIGMMAEFYKMTMGERYKFSRILAIAAGVILFLFTYAWMGCDMPGKVIILSMVPVFIVMINSLYVKDKTDFGKFANIYTGMLYIAVPLATLNLLVFNGECEYSGIMLICFFAIVWVSDAGAYIFGMALGQKYGKKLFPEVSPKKSWIGFYGGLLAAVLASLALGKYGFFDFPWYHCVGLAICMNVFGVYGDLIESQWKRHYLIKDSGNAIPGHGGLLDRFDSTLLAMPIGIIYLLLFNLL
jgi:phosphatidate cytidylyltransferase